MEKLEYLVGLHHHEDIKLFKNGEGVLMHACDLLSTVTHLKDWVCMETIQRASYPNLNGRYVV